MTLAEQLACVERSINRLIQYQSLHSLAWLRDEIGRDIAGMRAVAETLRGLIESRAPWE